MEQEKSWNYGGMADMSPATKIIWTLDQCWTLPPV